MFGIRAMATLEVRDNTEHSSFVASEDNNVGLDTKTTIGPGDSFTRSQLGSVNSMVPTTVPPTQPQLGHGHNGYSGYAAQPPGHSREAPPTQPNLYGGGAGGAGGSGARPPTRTQNSRGMYDSKADEREVIVDENEIIITDRELTAPSPSEGLTRVSYREAKALLGLNEKGLRHYFEAKQCSEIGEALQRNGVTGGTIALLTNQNIERDLELTIGQQLALKSFLKRVRLVERSGRRREAIFEEVEFARTRTPRPVPGCCPSWMEGLKPLFCCCSPLKMDDPDDAVWDLPNSKYLLTSDSLKLIDSAWADGYPAEEDRLKKSVGGCCNSHFEEEPQHLTRTDNILLTTLQDVDNYVLSNTKRKPPRPNCYQSCWGYEGTEVTHPAHVVVTYVDTGEKDKDPQRKQVTLKVDPKKAEEITQAILAGMDEVRGAAVNDTARDPGGKSGLM